MERVFDYEVITLQNMERNEHLIFICDADSKKVTLDREEEENESN